MTPTPDRLTDGLAPLISTILRKYGGTMRGRGDHDIFDALVRYRAALADRPEPGELDVALLAEAMEATYQEIAPGSKRVGLYATDADKIARQYAAALREAR